MIKCIKSLVLVFFVKAFAVSPIQLGLEAKDFFSKENHPISAKEGILYLTELRNEIIDLGYNVPTIKEIIIELESEFSIELLNKKKDHFFDETYLFHLDNELSWCSQGGDDEDIDWGKFAIGSCELLGGTLLAIIPCGLTRKIAAGIIVDGLRRILNETEEISESNSLNELSE